MMLRGGRAADGQVFLRPDVFWHMTRRWSLRRAPISALYRVRVAGTIIRATATTVARKLSSAAFGHGGFTGTVLWIDPDQNLFFVFLSNRLHPDGKGNVNQLAGKIASLAVKQIKDARQYAAPTASVMNGIDVLAARDFRDLGVNASGW